MHSTLPTDPLYLTWRWRVLRRVVLKLYGRRCMRCGQTDGPLQVDHIIAKARGRFGWRHRYKLRNMQVLCRACNADKGVSFADYRPLWARLLLPVKDLPGSSRH
jgi:5-methylcytosine-specific restriction endonuclease McrA